jgi:hypothetical protein
MIRPLFPREISPRVTQLATFEKDKAYELISHAMAVNALARVG